MLVTSKYHKFFRIRKMDLEALIIYFINVSYVSYVSYVFLFLVFFVSQKKHDCELPS